MMTPRERRIAKIVFWCVSPIMFAGLVRLFFLLFYFGLGMLVLWIFGTEHHRVVFWFAAVVSAGVTLVALGILYRLFSIYILDQP